MKKYNNFVCVICNLQYIHALGEFIFNLKTINFPYDRIVVYHNDIDELTQNDFKSIEPNIEFEEYSLDVFYREHKVENQNIENIRLFVNKYSHLTYVKYKVCEQLSRCKRVFYFDLDILIRDTPSLNDLFSVKGFAWRSSLPLISKFDNSKPCKELGITKPSYLDLKYLGLQNNNRNIPAPNAGMFVVSDDIDYNKALSAGREFISKYIYNFTSYIDECCLSFIVAKNNFNLIELNGSIFNCFPLDVTQNTCVIHFAGPKLKPWSSKIIQALFSDWMIYYNKFLDKSKFNTSKNFIIQNNISDVIKNVLIFDKFKRLINTLLLGNKLKINNIAVKDNIIEFKFNDKISIYIYINILSDLYCIELIIRSRVIVMNSNVKLQLQQLAMANKDILSIKVTNDVLCLKSQELLELDVEQFFFFLVNNVIFNDFIKSYFKGV